MHRRRGLICLAALGPLLLCGEFSLSGCATNPSSFQIGPPTGKIVGAAVGLAAVVVVTTVVIVEVRKSHHTIKGCVTSGPDGFELRNEGNQKDYSLTGVTSNLKVGDVIRVHGNKKKKQKDSAGDEDFAVEKMNRDYGPCKTQVTPAPAAVSPSGIR
jgi:hypothetical protein